MHDNSGFHSLVQRPVQRYTAPTRAKRTPGILEDLNPQKAFIHNESNRTACCKQVTSYHTL